MSYSRWISSQFYTYWCSSKVYDFKDELFACHTDLEGQYMFTYSECKEFIDEPYELVSRITTCSLSDQEVKELIAERDRIKRGVNNIIFLKQKLNPVPPKITYRKKKKRTWTKKQDFKWLPKYQPTYVDR